MSIDVTMRDARRADLAAIVAMLADDPLGATRESPDDLAPYEAALAAIDASPNEHAVVAERGGEIVGTLQLTFEHGLARSGAIRAQIEAVRVRSDDRGSGLGTTMIAWAIEQARAAGCSHVQLTSDATRNDAHRFYERLGFAPTHVGFKLAL